jgi:hypothetical protein
MTPRYEVQPIINYADGKVVNFRVTEWETDSRIATCYDEDNAKFIVYALNRLEELERELAAALKAKERRERSADDLVLSIRELERALERADVQVQLATRAKEEAERDAQRYRWLQHQSCGNAYGKLDGEDCYLQLNPRDMDAAIDEAMKK